MSEMDEYSFLNTQELFFNPFNPCYHLEIMKGTIQQTNAVYNWLYINNIKAVISFD